MSRRCIAGLVAGAALGVEGARISRKSSIATKELAGVPLLNYDLAYGGQARAAQTDETESWIVVAKRGVTTALLEKLCAKVPVCEAVGSPSEGGIPFFAIRSTEKELEGVLALAKGQVDFVEPDRMFYLDPEEGVEDTSSEAWGLDRVGRLQTDNTGTGTHIYVLDTGVRWTHSDFGGRASAAIDVTGGFLFPKVKQCDGDLSCGSDVQGHGTHCAGSAAGTKYGVAPGAQIYSAKVLSDSGSGSLRWSAMALDWLAVSAKTPTIASMSLGGPGNAVASKEAVEGAVRAGVTVVVAAGNSNSDACTFTPAYIPDAVTVGSTDDSDTRSFFSNYGSCVNIWAPGSEIISAGVDSDEATATHSGTSMACPHVSGAAALQLAEHPDLEPAAVRKALLSNAKKDIIKDLMDGDTNMLLWVGSQ